MLVLTRRRNEQIVIGGDITITVVDIGGGKVRLGIEAPDSIQVDRLEVAQRRKPTGVRSRRRDGDYV